MRGDEARIADYLLGELPESERADLERRAAADPAFAEEVARMRAVVEGLEAVPPGGWPSGAPPAAPPLPPLPGLSRPRRLGWRAPRPALAVAAAVALVAAGVAIGVLVTRGEDGTPPEGPALALARLGDAGPAARGEARVVGGDGGGLRLDVSGLAPSDGAFYELWLLDDGERMVSLGAFRVPASGHAQVDVPLPVPVTDFRYIDVSREPDDGNPAHSGDSVLRGPTGTA
ncbi:MAG TPA: anti-sigma factor [Miltoncostaeaceae bacterium]|nr:anti-sigma factor [Miltoncostaeaceae bacterium]